MKKKAAIQREKRTNEYDREDIIEIYAEAYYQALKRTEIEKNEHMHPLKSSIKKSDILVVLLQLLYKPKHIKKGNMADGLLKLITTMILDTIGYSLRLVIIIVLISLVVKHRDFSLFNIIMGILFSILGFLYSGFFLATSKELEQNKDSNYVISYSASLMGILAFVLALIALFK